MGWTAKRQIKVKHSFSNLDYSVAIRVDINLHTPHPASTVSPARSPPSSAPSPSLTLLPDKLISLHPGLAPSDPTFGLATLSTTKHRPVTLTLIPPRPAIPALAPPVAPTPPTSVYFGSGILEALSYVDLMHATYPPLAIYEADDLTSTARTTA